MALIAGARMPRCWATLGLMIVGSCCASTLADEARDELAWWDQVPSQPAVARGPTGVSSALAPVIEPPAPSAAIDGPLPSPPQAVVDAAVTAATFHGVATREQPAVFVPDEVSPSDVRTSTYAAIEPAAEPPEIETPSFAVKSIEHHAVEAAVNETTLPRTTELLESSPESSEEQQRRVLGPPRRNQAAAEDAPRRPLAGASWTSFNSESTATVGASLAIVLGLVLLMAWIWRRAAPRSTRALPDEVVSVIGRVPLANRQTAQLIKIGGKLVLVCVTPEGAKPLTEITNPEEVGHLLGLCEQGSPHSASAAFREVFDQLAREPAAGGFLGDEAPLVDRQKLADAYAHTPGGRAHA